MKTQPYFLLVFFLFPLLISAQCTLNAGADTTFCAPNYTTDTLYIGTGISVLNGTPPYTYEWSSSYQHPIFGLRTASRFLNDSTAANPILKDYSWEAADTTSLHAQPFYLMVTDANGQSCRDTIEISYTNWLTNTDDCRFDIPSGTTVYLRPNVGGGLPPYTYAWSPTYAMDDSTLRNPNVTPDSSLMYTVIVTDQIGCTFQNSCTIYLSSSSIDIERAYRLFSISPNPMRSTALIQLDDLPFQKARVEVLDLQGKVVFSQAFTSNSMQLLPETLSEGIYLCQIKDGHQVLATKKLIVIGE